MDKIVILIIIVVVSAGAIFWAVQSGIFSGPAPLIPVPEGALLFFGQNCPHCKIVEDFIIANNIDQKVKFSRLEIPFNGKTSPQLESNAKLLIQLAQGCKIDVSKGVSIPFLYDPSAGSGQAGKCLVGQDDVINFFKNAADIK